MPEIAEVARIAHFLRLYLVGKTIGKVVAPDDANVFGKVGTSGSDFHQAVAGKKVVAAGSQGKYFWIQLESPPHPVMHFGMTGWLHIRGQQTAYTRYYERSQGEEEQWPPKFWKFHFETDSSPKVEVAFTDPRRFGRIRLVNCPGEDIRKHSPLKENGPDPVVDSLIFTEEYLSQVMKKRHVPIKALLLDQATISGIGNWVGDEIMYQAKLHPEQYCDDFDDHDISTLYKAIRYVCDTAVSLLGDSDKFPEDWLFNHRWGKGKKDAATTLPSGEKIVFLTVGGRTSCVVPSVQKKKGRSTMAEDMKEEDADAEGKYFADNSAEQVPAENSTAKARKSKTQSAKRKVIKEEETIESKAEPARGKRARSEKKKAVTGQEAGVSTEVKKPRVRKSKAGKGEGEGEAASASDKIKEPSKGRRTAPRSEQVEPEPGRRRSRRLSGET